MASEVEEIKEKWSWIFRNLQRGLRGIRSAWRWCAKWNRAVHESLHRKYPRFTKSAGRLLHFFYETVIHPAFAVLLALLLVGFVISGAITIIVSASVVFAWLITVLWLAHSGPVKNLNILPRIVVVISVALCAAFAANWYVKWCLGNYALNQAKDKASSPPTEQKSEDQQLLAALNSALSEQLKKPASRSAFPRPNQPQLPPVIETAPSFGNLSDRAVDLSNEIMQDLYVHGWGNSENNTKVQGVPAMQMPTKPDERQQWLQNRSISFRFRFLARVVDIRNEFAQLHIRDKQLDELLNEAGMADQANKQITVVNPVRQIEQFAMLPQEIEEVAERLKFLATQARQRQSSKPLFFSETRVLPQLPKFPYETVVTITTDAILSRGYIVTEFDKVPALTGTDLMGSRLVFGSEIEGNRPLKDYLSSGQATQLYALEVGKIPFTPRQPIHVFSHGGTTPVHAIKVKWFDE